MLNFLCIARNFAQNQLGQIKTVYPTAYNFKQEKLYIDFKNDYHLTIEPNFEKGNFNALLKEFIN